MKKTLIGFVVLLACSTGWLHAQEVLVATLEHEGNVSVYYGGTALTEAHEAATHGDIITLSAGNFVAVNITKAITLRGAGYVIDVAKNRYPTALNNDFTISIKDKTDKRLAIEGIYSNYTITQTDTLTAANFSKCRFNAFVMNGQSINCSFLSCRFAGGFDPDNKCLNLYVSNCIINSAVGRNEDTASLVLCNCALIGDTRNIEVCTANYKNSIIVGCNHCSRLNESSSSYNNVFANDCRSSCTIQSGNIIGETNNFWGHDGAYSDARDYKLINGTDSIYIGTDGTQVGLYGGAIPFSDVPSTPQITKKNIASRTTVDGKLSVDIKVEVSGHFRPVTASNDKLLLFFIRRRSY